MKEIKTVTIVGMGALGLLFGAQIQKKIGRDNMCFLMDKNRKEKYQGQVFTENGEAKSFVMLSDEDVKTMDNKVSDLVIVSVKYKDLSSAVSLLKSAGCIGKDTIIISLMNGIDSEEILAKTFGMDNIVYCVSQGMDAMKFGNQLEYTKMGQLHIGLPNNMEQMNVDYLIKFFDKTEVPYIHEKDILYRMWAKFMLNVGINQTCMAYGVTYAGALKEGEANDTFLSAMEETVLLANAEGIPLSQKDIDIYVEIIRTLSPDGIPSMGQDRINKKASEVDMFAGKIISLGKKYHIEVPANEKLYRMVKEIEKEYT